MILFTHGNEPEETVKKFNGAYKKYYHYAYTIAFNVFNRNFSEMEDVMQEIFANVWKSHRVLTDEVSAKAWIATIARNTAINFLKKKAVRENKTIDVEDDVMYSIIGEEKNDPAVVVANEDSVERIYEEIKSMNKKYADVLLLTFKYHMTPEEIAETLDRNTKTVYTQLSRGKQILKEKLLSKEEVKL